MLVPMADFLNHSTKGLTHNIFNIKFEKQIKNNTGYILKKQEFDLSILGDDEITKKYDPVLK